MTVISKLSPYAVHFFYIITHLTFSLKKKDDTAIRPSMSNTPRSPDLPDYYEIINYVK